MSFSRFQLFASFWQQHPRCRQCYTRRVGDYEREKRLGYTLFHSQHPHRFHHSGGGVQLAGSVVVVVTTLVLVGARGSLQESVVLRSGKVTV
jgi:hypothetical protein